MKLSADRLGEILNVIAPEKYAAEWDNTGYHINLHQQDITGIMLCLDVTEKIINEAVEQQCNMVVSHHPLLFHPVRSVDNAGYIGKMLHMLISNNISLYCAHTSMDAAPDGLSCYIADIYGLTNRRVIDSTYREQFYKVAVTVPKGSEQLIKDAMARAGAGVLGDYSHCTYSVEGEGTFMPLTGSSPHIGSQNKLEAVDETWIQALCSRENVDMVVTEIKRAHPYEMPAIDVFVLENELEEKVGFGVVGDLPQEMTAEAAAKLLKEKLEIDSVRLAGDPKEAIQCIGICTGAGGDMVAAAQKMGAQLYITGEAKHNYYMERQIGLIEAGHFDTEKCFCALMKRGLQKQLDAVQYNVPVYETKHLNRPYINY
ncbi:MAG: Nif3-like dinuclear metal center hexameric protein [Christensenellaceae bacterium]|jgi:dinuclear metal center YbgI/SA1388 family protein